MSKLKRASKDLPQLEEDTLQLAEDTLKGIFKSKECCNKILPSSCKE
jgi:hypothetical protein